MLLPHEIKLVSLPSYHSITIIITNLHSHIQLDLKITREAYT
jgi:hypothetical protein